MPEVRFEKNDGVATLTIDRADRRNAITQAVVNQLRAGLMRASHDNDIRLVVLTGAGETVFCAGGDLGRETADAGTISRYNANHELMEFLNDLRLLNKPSIARVNGHALGAGLAILLACDLAVAVEDARLGCPELKVGVFPMLTAALLSRSTGPKKAFELMLTGQQITAVEAERMGLLNHAVARADLDIKLQELLSRVGDFSPVAVRLGREAFVRQTDMSLPDAYSYLLSQLTLNLQTEDAKEGVQAFLQKRKPEWKGR